MFNSIWEMSAKEGNAVCTWLGDGADRRTVERLLLDLLSLLLYQELVSFMRLFETADTSVYSTWFGMEGSV